MATPQFNTPGNFWNLYKLRSLQNPRLHVPLPFSGFFAELHHLFLLSAMAINLVHRFRSLSRTLVGASFLTRNISTSASLSSAPSRSSLSLINLLRPLVGAISTSGRVAESRCFATYVKSSPKDLPREKTVMEGCDFEHWLVVMEPPEGEPTRDEIIDSYIKTLASVVGSEEEARMKIYSVSTTCYYAFGALVSEELSEKIKECPRVRWVLCDSYVDVKKKDYGGEPFINGQALPYDPKCHEEWIWNDTTKYAIERLRNRMHGTAPNIDRIIEKYCQEGEEEDEDDPKCHGEWIRNNSREHSNW